MWTLWTCLLVAMVVILFSKQSILFLNLILLLTLYSYEVFHSGCVPVFKAHVHLLPRNNECICLNLNSNHHQGLIVQENVEGKASIRSRTNKDVGICYMHPFLSYHHIIFSTLKKSKTFFIII